MTMNKERATISKYVGMVWHWLRRQAGPLQALAAVVGIVVGIFTVIHIWPGNGDEPNILCVKFQTYPDNTKFGDNVKLNGIIFQSRHPKGHLFVNRSGRLKVLQFMNEGLTIDFPNVARKIEIKLADFHTPIKLDVLGDNVHILESRTINRNNSTELSTIKKSSFSIHKIMLSGGGNEGGLESVCAEIKR